MCSFGRHLYLVIEEQHEELADTPTTSKNNIDWRGVSNGPNYFYLPRTVMFRTPMVAIHMTTSDQSGL